MKWYITFWFSWHCIKCYVIISASCFTRYYVCVDVFIVIYVYISETIERDRGRETWCYGLPHHGRVLAFIYTLSLHIFMNIQNYQYTHSFVVKGPNCETHNQQVCTSQYVFGMVGTALGLLSILAPSNINSAHSRRSSPDWLGNWNVIYLVPWDVLSMGVCVCKRGCP